MTALRFTVLGTPVPCQRVRVAGGHAYTPERTRAYEALVRTLGQVAVNRTRWCPPEGAAFALTLDIYRAAKRGDWDNYAKAVCDALNGIAWPDDRHVEHATVRLFVDRAAPRVDVTVHVLGREVAA